MQFSTGAGGLVNFALHHTLTRGKVASLTVERDLDPAIRAACVDLE
jgi:hypothetical protein